MKFVKKTDLFIIFTAVLISVLLWSVYRLYNNETAAVAEIYYDSSLVQTVELDTGEEKYFSVPQNDRVVFHLDSDGSIRFAESDCRDKICIRSGKLTIPGESAACLPNKIIVKIIRSGKIKNDDIDIVIGKQSK